VAKRFHETGIWNQDWFLELPYEYKFLWFYIKDTCDHAGIWKPNIKFIEFISEKKLDMKKSIEIFNSDKERIQILPNKRWFILDFISFQYGPKLNPNNRVHQSVINLLHTNEVNLTSIRGLIDLKDRVKDKDKDKDKDSVNILPKPKKSLFNPDKEYKDYGSQDLLGYFCNQYEEIYKIRYMCNFGKDGKIFKELLDLYKDPVLVVDAVDILFEESLNEESWVAGKVSVGVFKTQINKIMIKLREDLIHANKKGSV